MGNRPAGDGMGENRRINKPAVDEDILPVAIVLGHVGSAHEARHADGTVLPGDIDERLASQDTGDALAERLAGRKCEDIATVQGVRETDIGAADSQGGGYTRYMAGFSGLRFQEFAPGRSIVKEVLHFDTGPRRRRNRLPRLKHAAFIDHFRADVLTGRSGDHAQAGHRRYRRQSLAPESEGVRSTGRAGDHAGSLTGADCGLTGQCDRDLAQPAQARVPENGRQPSE